MAFDLPPVPPAIFAEALPAIGAQVAAQGRAGCDGLVISSIEIRTYPPSTRTAAERAAVMATPSEELRGRRTEPIVVRAYLRIKEGERCTEAALRETERLLRAQRFVASAAARATPDGAGGVGVRLDVVDEVPWVAGVRVQSGSLSGGKFGTRNFQGRGVTLIAGGDWGGPFRPDARLHVGQFGTFGRPAFADAELERRHLGGLLRVGIAEPFLTDGQTRAMRAEAVEEVEYGRLVREGEDDAVSRVQRRRYDFGMLWRVGAARPSGLVGLGGLMLMGSHVRPSEAVVVISDSGLFASPDSNLVGRFPGHRETRVAGVVAIRALRFRTARRFEALRAEQDIGTGAQLEVVYGPSVAGSAEDRDVLTSGDLYLGVGDESSFASLRVRAEGRLVPGADSWRGVVGAAQFTWHKLTSEMRTRTLTISGARIDRLAIPGQFTLRDGLDGLIGFPDSRESGGRRVVARLEERRLLARPRIRAAVALGAFVDAGRLWAGDVPYGSDSPLRASAGLSLFGSYPASGKRLFRLDFGVPLNPHPGDSRFGIRLSSADRTGAFWREPRDVARVRENPATLIRW